MNRVAPHAGHVVALVQHLAVVPGEGEHQGAARGVEEEAHEGLLGAHVVGQQGGQVGVGPPVGGPPLQGPGAGLLQGRAVQELVLQTTLRCRVVR